MTTGRINQVTIPDPARCGDCAAAEQTGSRGSAVLVHCDQSGLLAKPPTLSTNRGVAAGRHGQRQATRVLSTAWVDRTTLTHDSLTRETVQPTLSASGKRRCRCDCPTAGLYPCPARHAGQCRRQLTTARGTPHKGSAGTRLQRTLCYADGDAPSAHCPT